MAKQNFELVQEQLARLGPAARFPWHTQQKLALRADTNLIAVVGGNRSGKSQVGQGILSRLVRREGPIYRRLKDPKGRLLKVWVAPQTDEKAQSVWEAYIKQALEGIEHRYVQTPHRVFAWKDEQGGGEVWLKSQEQGFQAFESDSVDLILLDEEPEDKRLFASCKTRLVTTHGVIVLTYTPLLGMTWTFDDIYSPVAEKPEYLIADRAWRRGDQITVIQMGMRDNPAARDGADDIANDPSMTEAEKAARLYGIYGFTEGLIFPQFAALKADSNSPFIIRERDFRKQVLEKRPVHWFLTADPNKKHGALLTAIDHEGNRYFAAEHYAVSLADSQHAEAYRAMLAMFHVKEDDVSVFADPGGAGSQAIINLAELGILAHPVPKDPGSVIASIKRMRRVSTFDRTHQHPITGVSPAPKLYFVDSLQSTWREGAATYTESRLLWELRQYRQKPKASFDTPLKQNDDLVDCARYFELAHADEPNAPKFDKDAIERKNLDNLSRQEQEKFDRILEKISRGGTRALITPA